MMTNLKMVPDEERNVLSRDASVELFLTPFNELREDPAVTEIAVNDAGRVWYEKNSVWKSMAMEKVTESHIQRLGGAVATYSAQRWDRTAPLLSTALPDGARIQLVHDPVVEAGRASFTLRKPSKHQKTLDQFAQEGLFERVRPVAHSLQEDEIKLQKLLHDGNVEQFLRMAVHTRKNIVVAGATGSGKTTFMKGLAREIPLSERLITIEDARELYLPHENVVNLLYSKGEQSTTKVGPKDLLQSCLRMKPDRILLAEVRGDECLYYVRNAASGHPGSMTSCHAGTPALAFEQMAIMIQDSPGGANLTFDVIKRLLVLTIDIVIQFQNHGGSRFISEIYYEPEKRLKASL